MRHSVYIFMCAILLIGCQAEEEQFPLENQSSNSNLVYIMDSDFGVNGIETVYVDSVDESDEKADRTIENAHIYGRFTGFYPTNPNATQNFANMRFIAVSSFNQVYGNAQVRVVWGENDENTWRWRINIDDFSIDNNDAIYSGIIVNESGERPQDVLGYRVWFRVMDEVAIGNPGGDRDQHYNVALFSGTVNQLPASYFFHNGPGSSYWTNYGVVQDVARRSDFIEVNN